MSSYRTTEFRPRRKEMSAGMLFFLIVGGLTAAMWAVVCLVVIHTDPEFREYIVDTKEHRVDVRHTRVECSMKYMVYPLCDFDNKQVTFTGSYAFRDLTPQQHEDIEDEIDLEPGQYAVVVEH